MLRLMILCLLLAGGITSPSPTWAQESAATSTEGEAPKFDALASSETLDRIYANWDKEARLAEETLARTTITGAGTEGEEDPLASDSALEQLRRQLDAWRDYFQQGKGLNGDKIASINSQIAALGPVPAEGAAPEPAEIAEPRAKLEAELAQLSAPSQKAAVALARADALISDIDRVLRERQANLLLKVWPSPLNPTHWDDAFRDAHQISSLIWTELSRGWRSGVTQTTLSNNLPLVLGLLAICIATTLFGRRWLVQLSERWQSRSSRAIGRVMMLLASTLQVILPTIGLFAFTQALTLGGVVPQTRTGSFSESLLAIVPFVGTAFFIALWLGNRVFPRVETEDPLIHLPDERRSEGRFLAKMLGAVFVLESLRSLTTETLLERSPQTGEATAAVLALPLVVLGAILLWRMAKIILQIEPAGNDSGKGFFRTILMLLGRATSIVAMITPLLAAFGYSQAATSLQFATINSLALLAFLLVMQELLANVWSVISRAREVEDREGLAPVLIGFTLALISLPLFALIWGMRPSELRELWARMGQGFQMGETTISPTNFLVFALIFSIGFMSTRLLQGALRSTILPRTRIEQGGQNAIVSGAGYLGIFLAAMIAINAAGINLTGLAIVASALSVGIGFGLQNIVQNFVAGIILMFERPVSEGDWIQVGQTQGIVKSISVRSTRIQTFDRNMVVVPNGDLVSQSVTNWTRFSMTGRLIVPVGVAYGTDTRKVEKVLLEIAEAQPMVILTPPPVVVFQAFGANSMDFELRVVLRDVNFSSSVKTEINHQIAERFAAEGIEIPFAQSDVTLRNMDEVTRLLESLVKAGQDNKPAAPKTTPKADSGPSAEETT